MGEGANLYTYIETPTATGYHSCCGATIYDHLGISSPHKPDCYTRPTGDEFLTVLYVQAILTVFLMLGGNAMACWLKGKGSDI